MPSVEDFHESLAGLPTPVVNSVRSNPFSHPEAVLAANKILLARQIQSRGSSPQPMTAETVDQRNLRMWKERQQGITDYNRAIKDSSQVQQQQTHDAAKNMVRGLTKPNR